MTDKHKYRWIALPPDFDPVDATVDEVASWRRESRWTVHLKVRTGAYASYRDNGRRKIIFASVKADRERAIAQSKNPTAKRRPGRPRKPRPEEEHATSGLMGRNQ